MEQESTWDFFLARLLGLRNRTNDPPYEIESDKTDHIAAMRLSTISIAATTDATAASTSSREILRLVRSAPSTIATSASTFG